MLEISHEEQSGVGAATIPITKADLEKLEQLYTFRDQEEVVAFLEEHPSLIAVLLEAPGKIEQYFGNVPLFLEVQVDPEISNYVHLLLLIGLTLGKDKGHKKLDKTLNKLDQLDHDGLINLPKETVRNLIVNVEFQ